MGITANGPRWTPRGQGDAGEASAICWVLEQGGCAFVACGHTPSDYDLLVDLGDAHVLKVQVKTSTTVVRDGCFKVQLATRGGNRSWSGTIKYLTPDRCDRLFVHVGDGRRWFIPTLALDARCGLVVGGPKYAEYEIAPGQPLLSRSGSTDYTR